MNRNTILFIVVLAVLSIVGITITQVYWFSKAFDTEQDQFNRDVKVALYNVANKFFEISKTSVPASNPIKQLTTNYYVVMINNEIDANLLEYLLKAEFEKRNVVADFEYGIYDCTSERMVYGNYVSFNDDNNDNQVVGSLPKWDNQSYYFGVKFPHKASIITNRMGAWIFFSAVLFLVIIFFAYALFIILRQKRLSEVQKDFINNMTHEFKTPISTIALSTEVLKDPKIIQQPSRLLNYATLIQNENQRLKNQVERVLGLADMDNNAMQLKKEKVGLHNLITDAVATLSTKFKESSADVMLNLKAENDLVEVDRLHLTNVIYNFLDNAIKYTKRKPEIELTSYNHEGKVYVDVKDNGIGIDRKQKHKIFNKFYRVPTGNIHDVKGFGLGLNYVKDVLKMHKGSVELYSSSKDGSTFKFCLSYVKS